jgi:hypothetical protein
MPYLAMGAPGVLDGMMQSVLLKALMGVMLFCSVESAVDASAVSDHLDDTRAHEAHHGPGPMPDHDEDDCKHFCHCTAHLPSIAVISDNAADVNPGSRVFFVSARRYSSRAIAPPLRPPIS